MTFHALPRLSTEDVAEVLEDAARRMTRYLKRRGLLDEDEDEHDASLAGDRSGLSELATAAASGDTPPAGPAFRRGAPPAPARGSDFEPHQSVGRAGFTLHAATRAGAIDACGREIRRYLRALGEPADAPPRRPARGPPYWSSRVEGGARASARSTSRARVLVVDDEPAICHVLARFCGTRHEVEETTDPDEAIRRVESGARFDVILCDPVMPGKRGSDVHDASLRSPPSKPREWCSSRVE